MLFHLPYPASPLLATLTKTAGVCTNNSQLGTPQAAPTVRPPEMSPTHPQLTAHYPLFTIFLTPLSATLIDHLVCVANTALTETLNPLDATLTKNRGSLLQTKCFYRLAATEIIRRRWHLRESLTFRRVRLTRAFAVRLMAWNCPQGNSTRRHNDKNSILPDRLTWYCAGCVACCRSFRDAADC